MSYSFKALQFSILLHSLVILFLILAGTSHKKSDRLLIIDFSMGDSDAGVHVRGKQEQVKANSMQKQYIRHDNQDDSVVNIEIAEKHPVLPQQAGFSVQQIPVMAYDSQQTAPDRIADAESDMKGYAAVPFTAATATAGDGHSSSGRFGDQAGSRYLKEHFAYIKEMVQKHLMYPEYARKMGWKGKVILSFIVGLSGHASGIQIVQSSGIEILDRNAVTAVQNASPFPKPPAEAKIILPILYRFR